MFKKSIAVFAALLLISSSLSAKSEVLFEYEYDCFSFADASATLAGATFNMSYQEEHDYFLFIYDACVNAGIE